MSKLQIGSTTVLFKDTPVVCGEWKRDFDPATGSSFSITLEGPQAQIEALEANYQSNGFRTNVTPMRGNFARLVATTTNPTKTGNGTKPDTQDKTTEKWEITTEYVTESIWSLPVVVADMKLFEAEKNPVGGIAGLDDPEDMIFYEAIDYKTTIVNAVKKGVRNLKYNGSPAGYDFALRPVAKMVYDFLVRGGTGYRVRRPVIRYTREWYRNALTLRMLNIGASDVVWDQSVLGKYLGIPNDILACLPPVQDSPSPTDTYYGWVLTRDDRNISRYDNKITESREVAVAFWSKLVYPNFVTA